MSEKWHRLDKVKLYGFRRGDVLTKEEDGSFTFFPTFDEAEKNLRPGEKVAHVSMSLRAFPKEGR